MERAKLLGEGRGEGDAERRVKSRLDKALRKAAVIDATARSRRRSLERREASYLVLLGPCNDPFLIPFS